MFGIRSQNNKVLQHLKEHGSITSLEAFEKYRITRLSGRIHDLREEGYEISTEMVYPEGERTHYGVYRLEKN